MVEMVQAHLKSFGDYQLSFRTFSSRSKAHIDACGQGPACGRQSATWYFHGKIDAAFSERLLTHPWHLMDALP